MDDFVHERGLAVVNVGNDGYIPNVLHTKSFAGAKVRNKHGKTRVNQLLRFCKDKTFRRCANRTEAALRMFIKQLNRAS
jgi:hypothetical protein